MGSWTSASNLTFIHIIWPNFALFTDGLGTNPCWIVPVSPVQSSSPVFRLGLGSDSGLVRVSVKVRVRVIFRV